MNFNRRVAIFLFVALAAVSQSAFAVSNIVISQVYGGGGNSGAPYHNDYIEVFNRGNTTAALRGPAGGGCTDTDNNSTDFATGAPNPRNTASPLAPCAGSTNPSGVGAATPNFLAAGDATLLTVTVTPGTNPPSTGLAVSADVSAIGGSATQIFFDDGTNGDVTAGDNIFSFATTVALGTSPGQKIMPATITDAQLRSGSANITLKVVTLLAIID